MLFDKDDEEKEKADYFESVPSDEEIENEKKKPSYKPEDPAYWEEEESEFEHLKPRSRGPLWLWIFFIVVVIGLIIACWLRYFSPYIDEATQYGYVENIERRGTVFKTYEGVLIPYKELMDTTRVYSRDFIFSVKDDKTAVMLKQAQLDAKPVRVGYRKYHATLPWRGASKIVVTEADTVNPEKILPPEFAPRR